MSQTKKKGLFASIPPRIRIAIALAIIVILAVLSFFAPPEKDDANVTGDSLPATVTVTHPVGTLTVNRAIDYNNVHITITQVTEAAAFSDDSKHGGIFTVRVAMQEQNMGKTQAPIGIDYASLARLVLDNGQVIAPKLVDIAPVVLPNTPQSGYIDFPVSSQVDLSTLAFRMGNGEMVAFSG
ncbi:MAG TPA: hypothetical protein VFA09_07740 [Ktedonobacteraceae bacterium]|jgi:hypothetical protein|nr:hypothetical protein [Ktedonobacteraceae bacterium]